MISYLKNYFRLRAHEWSLANSVDEWVVNDLSILEIKAIIATMKDSQRIGTLVWKKGWTEWKPIYHIDLQELVEPRRPRFKSPLLPFQNKKSAEGTVMVPAQKRKFVDRKYDRFEIKLPVTLVVGQNQFQTTTRDLSLGGTCLADPIPSWVAGYCTMLLETPDNRKIELVASLVEDQKDPKYRLEIVHSLKYEELKEWMETHNF